ncbi:hypothetical protein FRC07_013206 [Ceratobasidium sp. 392]|nr:hypothetical protein FRC07_013206 [Ceratobasidium sp. 392]
MSSSHGFPATAERDLRKSIQQTNQILDHLRQAGGKLESALLEIDNFKSDRGDIKTLRDDLDECIQSTEKSIDDATDLLGQQHRLLNLVLRSGIDIRTAQLLSQKDQRDLQTIFTGILSIKESLASIADKAKTSSKIDSPSHWFFRFCVWITTAMAVFGAIGAVHQDLHVDPYISVGFVASRLLVGAFDVFSRSRWGPVTANIKGARGAVNRIHPTSFQSNLELGPSEIPDPDPQLLEENTRLHSENRELESRLERLEHIVERPDVDKTTKGSRQHIRRLKSHDSGVK